MLKNMMCLISLMAFIINIIGCGTHKEFLLKRKWYTDETLKDQIVFIILKDGSTYELSRISIEGTKLVGKTVEEKSGSDLVSVEKEIEIQDIQNIWIEKSYADPFVPVFTFLGGLALISLIGFILFYEG